jgi:hypothetical protein
MYERIYDRTVTERYPARTEGEWWVLETEDVADLVVPLERKGEPVRRARAICLSHDIERGLGHVGEDREFAGRAERTSPAGLRRMIEVEAEAGVASTYAVVGCLLDEIRDQLSGAGHAIAFHSFDHRPEREDQLRRCREVDYRIKGYRPPKSVMTDELAVRNLLFHNFEWLASGRLSLGGAREPVLSSGIVRFPVHFDDYPLHTRDMSYRQWEEAVVKLATENELTVLGLHDCYTEHWLPRYPALLERLGDLGELRTLDDLAADLVLSRGV